MRGDTVNSRSGINKAFCILKPIIELQTQHYQPNAHRKYTPPPTHPPQNPPSPSPTPPLHLPPSLPPTTPVSWRQENAPSSRHPHRQSCPSLPRAISSPEVGYLHQVGLGHVTSNSGGRGEKLLPSDDGLVDTGVWLSRDRSVSGDVAVPPASSITMKSSDC